MKARWESPERKQRQDALMLSTIRTFPGCDATALKHLRGWRERLKDLRARGLISEGQVEVASGITRWGFTLTPAGAQVVEKPTTGSPPSA